MSNNKFNQSAIAFQTLIATIEKYGDSGKLAEAIKKGADMSEWERKFNAHKVYHVEDLLSKGVSEKCLGYIKDLHIIRQPGEDRNGIVHDPACLIEWMMDNSAESLSKNQYGYLRWRLFGVVAQLNQKFGISVLTNKGKSFLATLETTPEAKVWHTMSAVEQVKYMNWLRAAFTRLDTAIPNILPEFTCSCGRTNVKPIEPSSVEETKIEAEPEPTIDELNAMLDESAENDWSAPEIEGNSLVSAQNLVDKVRDLAVKQGLKGHALVKAQKDVLKARGNEKLLDAAMRLIAEDIDTAVALLS
jgi:hypothetical protein